MANASEIASLITAGMAAPTGPEDVAFHTGVIRSWDRVSGVNTVEINGVVLTNLKAVQSGIGVAYNPGEVVVVIRKQTQYFILGKVAAPGGAAGSAVQSALVGTAVTQASTSGAYTDLSGSPGPAVTTYIGSSRQCLVIFGATMGVNQAAAAVSFAVSGASSVAAGAYLGMGVFSENVIFNQAGAMTITTTNSITGVFWMNPGHGLQSGSNTFTLKYRTGLFGTGTGAEYSSRFLTVIPL